MVSFGGGSWAIRSKLLPNFLPKLPNFLPKCPDLLDVAAPRHYAMQGTHPTHATFAAAGGSCKHGGACRNGTGVRGA